MGPVGLPRDEVSTHGDDGSLRLLAAPAVLAVVVLLLLVTACSGASGEKTRASGDGGDATAVAAAGDGGGDDDVDGDDNAEGDDGAAGAGGQVQPAEVTEDGRMLQPNGHQGIWFETAPGDPLGKLVYESQRFVGDPVELELLGDRALMPEWADMPDPCSAEVMLRMGELGLASISEETGVTVFDLSYCGAMGEYDSENYDSSIGGVSWSIRRQVEEGVPDFIGPGEEGLVYDVVGEGEIVDFLGCVATAGPSSDGFAVSASYMGIGDRVDCQKSEYVLQLVLNTIGWIDD